LGFGLLLSLAFALWSAMSVTSMLMQTLTIAYEEEDDRGILQFYGLALAFTLGLIAFGLTALALVAGHPRGPRRSARFRVLGRFGVFQPLADPGGPRSGRP